MEDTKTKKVMLSVSEYSDLNSINNLILVGKNIERVDNKYAADMIAKGMEDVDVLLWFMKDYLNKIKTTNAIDPMSSFFVESQEEFVKEYTKQFADIVINVEKYDNYLNQPIKNPSRFKKILEICDILTIATSYFIYNQRDVFTVSILTLMNILNLLDIKDEELNFALLKVVGRRNESKPSDVDNWLEQVDHDYEIFHLKNISDHVLNLMSVSPRMVIDLTVYTSLLSTQVVTDEMYDMLEKCESMEETETILQPVFLVVLESVVSVMDTIVDSLNKHKYEISKFYVDLFERELVHLPYCKIVPKYKEESTTMYTEDVRINGVSESETIKVKKYKSEIDSKMLYSEIKLRLHEFLIAGNILNIH